MDTAVISSSSYSSPSDGEGLNVSSSDCEGNAASVAVCTVRYAHAPEKGLCQEGDRASASRRPRTPSAAAESASTTLRRMSGDFTTRMQEAQNRTSAMERYKMMVQAARLVPTPQRGTTPASLAVNEEAEAEEPAYPVSTEVSEDSSDDDDDNGSLVQVSAIQERRADRTQRAKATETSATSAGRLSDRRAVAAAVSALKARSSASSSTAQTATKRQQLSPDAADEEAAAGGTEEVPLAGDVNGAALESQSRAKPAVMISKRRPSDVDKEMAEVAALAEAAAGHPPPSGSSSASSSATPASRLASSSAAAAAVAAVAAKRAATARAIAELEAAEKAAHLDTEATKRTACQDALKESAENEEGSSTSVSTLPAQQEPAGPRAADEEEEAEVDKAVAAAAVVGLPDGPVLPRSHLTPESATGYEPDYNPIYTRVRTPRGHTISSTADVGRPSQQASLSSGRSESTVAPTLPQQDAPPARPSSSGHAAPSSARRPSATAEAKKPANAVAAGSGFWVRPTSALYEMTASIAAKRAGTSRPSSSSARGGSAAPVSARGPSGRVSSRHERRSATLDGEGEVDADSHVTSHRTDQTVVDVASRRSTQHRRGPRPSTSTTTTHTEVSATEVQNDAPSRNSEKPSPSKSAKLRRTRSSTGTAQPTSARLSATATSFRTCPSSARTRHVSASRDSVDSSTHKSPAHTKTDRTSTTTSSSVPSHNGAVFARLASTNHSGLQSAAVGVPRSARSASSSKPSETSLSSTTGTARRVAAAASSARARGSAGGAASARQQESFQRHCSRLSSLRAANEDAEKKAAAKDVQFRAATTRTRISRKGAGRTSTTSSGCASAATNEAAGQIGVATATPPQTSVHDLPARLLGTVSKQLIFDEERDAACADDDEEAEPCPLSKAPRATARRESGASVAADLTPPKSRRREGDENASPARPDDGGEAETSSAAVCEAPQTHVDPTSSVAARTQDRIAEIRAQYEQHLHHGTSPRPSACATEHGVSPSGLPPLPRPSPSVVDPIASALQSAAYQRRCVLPCYLCGELQSLNAYSVHLGLCHKKTMSLMATRGLSSRDDLMAVVRSMSGRLVPNCAEDAAQPEREAFTMAAYACAKQLLLPCEKCGTMVRLHDVKEHELLCGRAHYEKSKAAARVREAVQTIETGAASTVSTTSSS